MKIKDFILIFFLFMILLSGTAVNALSDDVVDDAVSEMDSIDESISVDDEIIYEDPGDETINTSNCECCSFIIQENDETVFAFRQDSPLNGHGIKINLQNWHGLSVLKQEIDTQVTYFFHGIITENGWVIGQGGSQYDSPSRSIENIAASMVTNNDISPASLNSVKNILANFNYGHFVIKAPDGRYGMAFSNTYVTGVLQPGEFMVIPNYYSGHYKGNYRDYGSNLVDAIINICSYETSGENRRDLISYDYKTHETANGLYKGVDVYATNDNGHNVGRNTAGIVTHFYYNGQYYPPSVIPQNPGKLYVATHIFQNQAVGNAIELIEGITYSAVAKESSVHYKIKHISNENTVVFDFGENVEFIKADVSHGSYNWDNQQHKLIWNLPALNEAKDIIITFKTKVRGNYNIHAFIQSISEENNMNYYATDYGAVIDVKNVTKYYGGDEKLNIYLKDTHGVPLVGESVSVSINGVSYSRTVSNTGLASLAINLNSGEYDVIVSYDVDVGKNKTQIKVIVKTTLFSSDIEKFYKNDTQFYASFLDTKGNLLKNSKVNFNVNGVIYTRNTDNNGVAKLNINLIPKTYVISTINPISGEILANTIIVKSVLVENRDLVKYCRNNSQYTVKLLNGQGESICSGKVVTFNINGVFYNRTTNESGIAQLNINLNPGDYIITASYNGASVSNYIIVLTRLITNDLSMNYKDNSKFKAIVLNEHGGIASGEIVTFNINGVFYDRIVDSTGLAKLNINLMSGKYVITTTWNKYSKSNVITIT